MRRNRRITTCGMLGTDRIRSIKDTGHVRSPVQGDDCVRRITRRWHNPTMRTLALVVVLVLSCVGVVMPVGCSPGRAALQEPLALRRQAAPPRRSTLLGRSTLSGR